MTERLLLAAALVSAISGLVLAASPDITLQVGRLLPVLGNQFADTAGNNCDNLSALSVQRSWWQLYLGSLLLALLRLLTCSVRLWHIQPCGTSSACSELLATVFMIN
jgi:hypothetical protein